MRTASRPLLKENLYNQNGPEMPLRAVLVCGVHRSVDFADKGVAMNTYRPGPVRSASHFGDPQTQRVEDDAAVHALRRPRPEGEAAFGPATVGGSAAMERLRSQVTRIAPYYRTALLTGPQGAAKVGLARMLHALSPCSGGEFVACEAARGWASGARGCGWSGCRGDAFSG